MDLRPVKLPREAWVGQRALRDALYVTCVDMEVLSGHSRGDARGYYEAVETLVGESVAAIDHLNVRPLSGWMNELADTDLHRSVHSVGRTTVWQAESRWARICQRSYALLARHGNDMSAVRSVFDPVLRCCTEAAPVGDYEDNPGRWSEYASEALDIAQQTWSMSDPIEVAQRCERVFHRWFGGLNGASMDPIVDAVLESGSGSTESQSWDGCVSTPDGHVVQMLPLRSAPGDSPGTQRMVFVCRAGGSTAKQYLAAPPEQWIDLTRACQGRSAEATVEDERVELTATPTSVRARLQTDLGECSVDVPIAEDRMAWFGDKLEEALSTFA